MKRFKQLIQELPNSHVVCAFGQFQPPTAGHEFLIKAVQKLGESVDHVIYTSVNEDKKNNPLPADRKVYFLKRMFPEAIIKPAYGMRSIVEVALALNVHYKNLTIVAGSDKVAECERELNKHNGKLYQFESIKVISLGTLDPDSNTLSPLSSIKMCESAKVGNFTQFKKGVPYTLTELDSRRLMNDVRRGMGLEPIRETVNFQRSTLREDYVAGKILNVGNLVESAGEVYAIVKRGSNHLLLKNSAGALVTKWITDVKELCETTTKQEPQVDSEIQVSKLLQKKDETMNLREDIYSSDYKVTNVQNADGTWSKRKYHPNRIGFKDRFRSKAATEQPTQTPPTDSMDQYNPTDATDPLDTELPPIEKKAKPRGKVKPGTMSFESWILNGKTPKNQEDDEKKKNKNKRATSITTPNTKTINDRETLNPKSSGSSGGFDPF